MCGVFPHLQGPTVPALHVLGWFDAEDFAGPLEVYRRLEKDDRDNRNFLTIGPWTHGSWTFDEEGRKVGSVDFGAATARAFREGAHREWFCALARRQATAGSPRGPDLPDRFQCVGAVRSLAPGDERAEALPASGQPAQLRRAARGGGQREFRFGPGEPGAVPEAGRVRYPEGWPGWQAEDQRIAHGRPDVLTWVSEPLTEDLVLAGDAVAHLFAATTGSDADWVVKLIDVYPDTSSDRTMAGYQFMVAGEVFRSRFRKSFSAPEPVTPNEVVEYSINLRDRSHRFRSGHRLMVQVQSTWFPLIDRNPQTWVPNIFFAEPAQFRKATHTVHLVAAVPYPHRAAAATVSP